MITPEKKQAVLQQFEQILKRAIEKKASDVHLKAGLPPIVRVNGNLFYLGEDASDNVSRLSKEQLSQFAYALMSTRQADRYEIGEEVDLGFELAGQGRFRINVCAQRSNPRIVARHIPEQIRNFAELGVPIAVEQLANAHRGLILVTGATGSGKSTTLAAMIDHIARSRSCHILTIEDPIEFGFKDRKSIVTQREVGLDTQTFAGALKYALRQDPDVILVGEMRDEETILMALSAAETGHLVLSTLHTLNAMETINRVLGSVSPASQNQARAQLTSALVGVVSQRLVRRRDAKGRVAAVEVMVTNQRIKEMIADPARTHDITRAIEESRNQGMQSFDQSLMDLLTRGVITQEEAMNHCTNSHDFHLRLGGVVEGGRNEGSITNVAAKGSVAKGAHLDEDLDVIQLDVSRKK